MSRMQALVGIVATLAGTLTGCQGPGAPEAEPATAQAQTAPPESAPESAPPVPPEPAAVPAPTKVHAAPLTTTDVRPVIDVDSAQAFVDAIGSERILRLKPGEYVLSDLPDQPMQHVRWDPVTDGRSLTIRNVSGLKIIGAGPEPTRLIATPRYAFVLNFENCRDIELANLTLGHAPQTGYCDNGVLGAKNVSALTLRHCDLFGSGTEGLTLSNVAGLICKDTIIRDCTYGIMTIKGSRDLIFERCRFVDNAEWWGVNLHDTREVMFLDCVFRDNEAVGPLINAVSTARVWVQGGQIMGNKVKRLTNSPRQVQFSERGP